MRRKAIYHMQYMQQEIPMGLCGVERRAVRWDREKREGGRYKQSARMCMHECVIMKLIILLYTLTENIN